MKNRLKYYITLKGVKQKDMACILGITPVTLSRYIKEDRSPDVRMAIRIAKMLDVKVEDIWI